MVLLYGRAGHLHTKNGGFRPGQTLPNMLIIGDSISEPGSGYGPGVERLLMRPG